MGAGWNVDCTIPIVGILLTHPLPCLFCQSLQDRRQVIRHVIGHHAR